MADQARTQTMTAHGRRREQNTLVAATLTNGPNELIDFLLPLWAGATIGLSAIEVGVLLAVEMALSVVARPIAGVLADTRERRYIAASGAVMYALSCAGYAAAEAAPLAYAAAGVGGIGGALLWVSLRAIISERLDEDSSVFPRLLASQETGSWTAMVAGMILISAIGFVGIFVACAVSCVLAAVILVLAPRRRRAQAPAREGVAAAGLSAVSRRLRPMLFAVAMTMMAEAAVSLLLLLHLQRGFGLEIVQVAYVFLPGAIAMGVAAEYLHQYVVRFGRTRILMLASLASATFAASLAWAPNPYVIAALWILSGLAWAAIMPLQQAVIAEASGEQAGRGMGVYESASLIGAMLGTLVAGALYDGTAWAVACLAASGMLLAGAVIVPRAVRRLDVADMPPAPPQPKPKHESAESTERESDPEPVPEQPADQTPGQKEETKTPRQIGQEFLIHAALFGAVQVMLFFVGLSWVYDVLTADTVDVLLGRTPDHTGLADFIYGSAKIWALILVVDALWTGTKVLAMRIRPERPRA